MRRQYLNEKYVFIINVKVEIQFGYFPYQKRLKELLGYLINNEKLRVLKKI